MTAASGAVAAMARNRVGVHLAPPRIVNDTTEMTDAQMQAMAEAEAEAEASGPSVPRRVGRTASPMARNRQWYIIDPRTSRFTTRWNALLFSCLLFTAIVTPYDVGCGTTEHKFSEIFVLNRIVGAVFLLDTLLQFWLMYPSEKDARNGSSIGNVEWIHDQNKIVKHYVKGRFTLDLLSVSADIFDITALGVSSASRALSLGQWRLLRLLRIPRLFRLVRIAWKSRWAKGVEARVAINYDHLSVVKCVILMLVSFHWVACFWVFQALWFSPAGPLESWLGELGRCVSAETLSMRTHNISALDQSRGWVCDPPWRLYTSAIVVTQGIVMMGPRDGNNSIEEVLTFVMCFSGFVLGSLVFASILKFSLRSDPMGQEFNATINSLNQLIAMEGLPQEFAISLRQYFHQTTHLQLTRMNKSLTEKLSPMLQGQVVWKVNERWLRHVWFLRSVEDGFMVRLSLELRAAVFAPAELCPPGYMYIVQGGIALYGGKVLTCGKVWGDDIMMSFTHLRSKYIARCMTYVEVTMVSCNDLMNIAKHFPPTLKVIRRQSFWMGFRREMIRRAAEVVHSKEPALPASSGRSDAAQDPLSLRHGLRQLTEESIAELREAFSLFDRDRSGHLTPKEMTIALESLGLGNDRSAQVANEASIRGGDPSGGLIEFKEFCMLMCRHMSEPEDRWTLTEAFKILDADSSGSINHVDLKEMMRGLMSETSESFRDADIDHEISKMDVDGDGMIPWNEVATASFG